MDNEENSYAALRHFSSRLMAPQILVERVNEEYREELMMMISGMTLRAARFRRASPCHGEMLLMILLMIIDAALSLFAIYCRPRMVREHIAHWHAEALGLLADDIPLIYERYMADVTMLMKRMA